MTAMVGLRARVRTRLEETVAGIWSDAMVDEAILATLEEYNHLLPKEERVAVSHPGGVGPLAVPGETQDVVRVVLGSNRQVLPRRGAGLRYPDAGELAWEWFGGALHFSKPLPAQTVDVWRTRPHEPDEVPQGDRGLLVLGGIWRALHQHSVQELRRGVPSPAHTAVRFAEREYQRAFDARRRRLRIHLAGAD
jgi:hypothetical protein